MYIGNTILGDIILIYRWILFAFYIMYMVNCVQITSIMAW